MGKKASSPRVENIGSDLLGEPALGCLPQVAIVQAAPDPEVANPRLAWDP